VDSLAAAPVTPVLTLARLGDSPRSALKIEVANTTANIPFSEATGIMLLVNASRTQMVNNKWHRVYRDRDAPKGEGYFIQFRGVRTLLHSDITAFIASEIRRRR